MLRATHTAAGRWSAVRFHARRASSQLGSAGRIGPSAGCMSRGEMSLAAAVIVRLRVVGVRSSSTVARARINGNEEACYLGSASAILRRVDLRQLETFVIVADERSFSRAAQRLHVVQSA